MKFDTSKIEALQDARRQRENCMNDPWFPDCQKELKTISELLFTLYQGHPLIGGQFADFCQLTKEPTPDPQPYEPTEDEKNWLEAEAHEEKRRIENAYYEGYSYLTQKHF